MSKYGDDQCVQCGGTRVAGSPLCVGCLVALVNTYAPAHDIAEARIKELQERFNRATELVDRLLDHISSEAVYTSELRGELRKAKGIIKGGDGDEENRQAKDIKE